MRLRLLCLALLLATATAAGAATLPWRAAFIRAGDIWTVAEGGEPQQLTHDGKNAFPFWSWDGRRLAFVKRAYSGPENTGYHLWVMDADGRNARKLFGDAQRFAYPWQFNQYRQSNWSPDGNWIALSSATLASLKIDHHDSPSLSDLWVVNTHTDDAKRLVPGQVTYRGYMTCYVWSPDGRRLVYWNANRHWGRFAVVDLAGRDRVLRQPVLSSNPSYGIHDPVVRWDRDGRSLLLGRNSIWDSPAYPRTALYRVTWPGRRAARLPLGPVYWINSLSHSRHRVCYTVRQTAGDQDLRVLYVSKLGGTDEVRLSARPYDGSETVALWSPDDARIAYHAEYGAVLRVTDSDRATDRPVTFRVPQTWHLIRVQWAPDSRHLLILAGPDRSREDPGAAVGDAGDINVLDTVTGTSARLTEGAASTDLAVIP